MKINKQLFEDVLSGKLKGTFVLRDGTKVSHKTLHRNADDFYPYAVSEGDTLGFYSCFSDSNKFATDIIDFIPDTNMEERIGKLEKLVETQQKEIEGLKKELKEMYDKLEFKIRVNSEPLDYNPCR